MLPNQMGHPLRILQDRPTLWGHGQVFRRRLVGRRSPEPLKRAGEDCAAGVRAVTAVTEDDR